jgi:membrane-bound ClpP family serine protease
VSLLLGGWFLYDRTGGVEVSPPALIGVAVGAGLFFGLVVAKALAIRHRPPVQLRPILGSSGVALSTVTPTAGLVRVAAEEWQAITANGEIDQGVPIRVTAIDGLMLTVEPAADEHAPARDSAPASKGRDPA